MNCIAKKIDLNLNEFDLASVDFKIILISQKEKNRVKKNWRIALAKAGYTQKEAAEKLGWFESQMCSRVAGKIEWQLSDALDLCDLLNVTLKDIFLA